MKLSYHSLCQRLDDDVVDPQNVQYARYLTAIDQQASNEERDFGFVSTSSLSFSLAALALYKCVTLGISNLQRQMEMKLRESLLSDIAEIANEHKISIDQATNIVLKVSKEVSLNPPKDEIGTIVKSLYGADRTADE